MQIYGSQTNYAGVLEHGNTAGIGIGKRADLNDPNSIDPLFAGNANIAGYTVATTRAYIDPITGFTQDARALVSSNDYIGYYNFLGLTLDPTTFPESLDGAFAEFASIRSFVNGYVGGGQFGNLVPGGNLVILTKKDGITNPGTGYLHPAFSLENDQSAHFYGGTVNHGGEALSNYMYVDGDTQSEITVTPDTPVVIIDSGTSSTIAAMTITPPPTVTAKDGQKFTVSAAADVTACSVVTYYTTTFYNETIIPATQPGFPDTVILTIPASNLLQSGLVVTTAYNPSGEYVSGQVILSVIDNDPMAGTANVVISAPADSPATPGVTTLSMLSASSMNIVPSSLTAGDSWTWIFRESNTRWYKI